MEDRNVQNLILTIYYILVIIILLFIFGSSDLAKGKIDSQQSQEMNVHRNCSELKYGYKCRLIGGCKFRWYLENKECEQ